MAGTMRLSNRTAVVTGAAGGIGRAISLSLARRGCHLALADVNETGLVETAQMASATGVRIARHLLDVADRVAVAAFPGAVTAEHAGIHLFLNNSRVGLCGLFVEGSGKDLGWPVCSNLFGDGRT